MGEFDEGAADDTEIAEQARVVVADVAEQVAHSHGGDITLIGVERGVVTVSLTGACDGCPAAAMTLHRRIEDERRAIVEQIIKERYSPTEWNIYGAQASDGDNWHHDSGRCREILNDKLLPLCRYYAYVQVADEDQNLWEEYTRVRDGNVNFAMQKIVTPAQIFPVFRDAMPPEENAKHTRMLNWEGFKVA